MKNKLIIKLTAVFLLLLTSCSNDEILGPQGGLISTTFSVQVPSNGIKTKSGGFASGAGITDLFYEVFESGIAIPVLNGRTVITNASATFQLDLLSGKSYDIIFWASSEDSPYTLKNGEVTINYDLINSNDDNLDALYAIEKGFIAKNNPVKNIALKRPFAQLNIGTNDFDLASNANFTVTESEISLIVPGTFNLLTGVVSDEARRSFRLNTIPSSEPFPIQGYKYLAMNYILVGEDKSLVDIEFLVSNGANNQTRTFSAVPVQRNYKTNIFGKLLTNNSDFSITIDARFENSENTVQIWDGTTKVAPEINNEGDYLIASASNWVWLKGKNLNGKNLKLVNSIDFGGFEVQGLGFSGTFDGNGYSMSNLTILPGGSNYSNGLFQGDASGKVVIKNLTIKDVNVNSSSTSNGYAGVLFGDLQTGSTGSVFENVKVENATIKGVQSVGGLIGFLAVGTSITITGSSVNNSSLSNYLVQDESGFVAGLVGRPLGTILGERNSVSNTTIFGFYAARRGEMSIGEAYGSDLGNALSFTTSNVNVTKFAAENAVSITTAAELEALNVTNKTVFLNADIDFGGATLTRTLEMWGNSTFQGNGHKISNFKTAITGSYASSLFRGDANGGNKIIKNLIIENATSIISSASGGYASILWSDLQNGANLSIENVHMHNVNVSGSNSTGAFVGFVGGGTTNVTIKNSSIKNSEILGGNPARVGALVGRAFGVEVSLEGTVVVENVTVNGSAATTSLIVQGEQGYTGTVEIK